jgi:hypothetical protein
MGRAIGGSAEKARRLADAQGVDDVDGHALAGFIEAEGSFEIRSNNGGSSWICGMTLTQRADDADMLVDIARVTGLGRLRRIPAQRTSRLQVSWSMHSKFECRRLTELLSRYPLRGRKRSEFEVWAAAVDRWSEQHVAVPLRATADGLISYLGGFFTGEGSFSLDGRAAACIHVRADDAPLLRMFQEHFRLGRISYSTPPNVNPSVRWTVCRRAELSQLIALLDAAWLRGRKRREFSAWRLGAAEYARGPERDQGTIERAASALRQARSYVECEVALPSQPSGREAYVEVLRAFAAGERADTLTATAYTRARADHPEWPTRDTIALAFGGLVPRARGG